METDDFMEQVNSFVNGDDDPHILGRSGSRQRLTTRKREDRNYLSSFKQYLSKTNIFIACLIFALSICIIIIVVDNRPNCDVNFQPSAFKSDAKRINFSNSVILSDGSNIWTFDPRNKFFDKIVSSENITAFDIYNEETIFWFDERTKSIIKFNEYTKKIYPMKWKPKAMATDFITNKFYILDQETGTLNVMDVERKYYRTLKTDLKQPCDLVLDSVEGYIFIVLKFISICRISTDGNSTKSIIKGETISALTIDRSSKIIYWSEDFKSISSSNYDGRDIKELTKVSSKIDSLSILHEKLTQSIFWVSKKSLYSCKIYSNSCNDIKIIDLPSSKSITIKILLYRRAIENPCRIDNAGCDQLCLITDIQSPPPRYLCACNDDWMLNTDMRSCRPIIKGEISTTEYSRLIVQVEKTETSLINNRSTLVFNAENFDTKTTNFSQLDVKTIKDTDTIKNKINLSNSIVISDGENLWTMDLTDKKLTLVQKTGQKKMFDAFDFYPDQTIIWSDEDSSTIKTSSSEYQTIHYPAKWKPRILRVDTLTNNIYIVDRIADTVNILDRQGKHHGIAVSDLENPCDLALDPASGLMFIALKSDSILKANMNGENITTIVRNAGVSTITLDRENKLIYWAVNFIGIESMSYEGTKRMILKKIPSKFDSLTIFQNQHIFWTSKSVLWACEIENRQCKNDNADLINYNNIRTLNSPFEEQNIDNPCRHKNGGCQHLCLPIPGKNQLSIDYSCACSIGWEVNPDGKTCKPVSDFILYTQGNFVRGRITDPSKESFVDAILSTEFQVESLQFKSAVDFDYDLRDDRFFFSDDYNIFKISIKTDGMQEKVVHVTEDFHIKDLAYDWMTGNLYYVQKSRDNNTNHSLMVLRITSESQFIKTITSFTHESDFPQQACPHGLIVHPGMGYLYYTAWNNLRKDIQRTTTNGKGLKEIGNVEYHNKYRIIGIDFDESRLYWVYDRWKISIINHADLDGSNVRKINISGIQYPNTLVIHNQWLYLSNSSTIFRLDKKNGGSVIKMVPRFDTVQIISGVRIVSLDVQKMLEDNPCVIGNGDCQQFCFATPNKICDCEDNRYVFNGNFCN